MNSIELLARFLLFYHLRLYFCFDKGQTETPSLIGRLTKVAKVASIQKFQQMWQARFSRVASSLAKIPQLRCLSTKRILFCVTEIEEK